MYVRTYVCTHTITKKRQSQVSTLLHCASYTKVGSLGAAVKRVTVEHDCRTSIRGVSLLCMSFVYTQLKKVYVAEMSCNQLLMID